MFPKTYHKGYTCTKYLFILSVAALLWVLACSVSTGQTDTAGSREAQISIKTYIRVIQENTPYMFLYREALINGLSIHPAASFENEDWLDQLATQLKKHKVEMSVDAATHQIYLSAGPTGKVDQRPSPPELIRFSGRVVDASSGESLPFATVYWAMGTTRNGTSANKNGQFQFTSHRTHDTLSLAASYVGYQRETVKIPIGSSPRPLNNDITLRLQPKTYMGEAIYIRAHRQTAGLDTVMINLMELGKWSPLGESNTIRTLQLLPAVSQQTALNDGVHIRGSSPSGFSATLDEMPIYNASHLFGLVDSFNADALQTSALYYDVIPASEGNATGGLLALNTRSGSLSQVEGSGGLSNSAARITIEGPIDALSTPDRVGQWSALLAGRVSYMNQLHWLGNQSMLKYGLNLDRDHNLAEDVNTAANNIIGITGYDATFYDIHSRLHYESQSNRRLNITLYSGGDDASVTGSRLRGAGHSTRPPDNNARVRTSALYDWANHLASLHYSQPLPNNLHLDSRAGFSIYDSQYFKDDFLYLRTRPTEGNAAFQFHPFRQQNRLETWKIQSDLSYFSANGTWQTGLELKHHLLDYSEENLRRSTYSQQFTSNEWAGYLQVDSKAITNATIEAGLRLQYFSDGDYLNLDPRFRFTYQPAPDIEAKWGYSQTTQYLNLLSPPNSTGITIWIPSTFEQPPTTAYHNSMGVGWNPNNLIHLNVEGYLKIMKNVRIHELTDRFASEALKGGPWYYNNKGLSRGLEFMVNFQWEKLSLEHTYTLSHTTMENPLTNAAKPYHPDWYRKHRYGVHATITPFDNLSLFSSVNIASGAAVNPWIEEQGIAAADQNHLDAYYRLDSGINYKFFVNKALIKFNAMVYNLTDHSNEWYREEIVVIEQGSGPRRFSTRSADVYDLGIQPSFDISIHW